MAKIPLETQPLTQKTRDELKKLDHLYKVLLLAVSMAALVLLVVSAVRENYFPEWRRYQLAYASILQKKAVDDWGKQIAASFDIELRQNVVPELDTVDRCVSCHTGIDDPRMTDVENPYRVHPGDYVKNHDPNKFGCTVCHRGQGRAVVFAEAKAVGYHWDYPLLPTKYAQSACGLCHGAVEVDNSGGEIYAEGAGLFTQKGCYSCHKLGDHGGSLGPGLDNEGLKTAAQLPMAHITDAHTLDIWLAQHFDNPQKIVAQSKMPPPQLSREETTALTTYMLSLQKPVLPRSYLSPQKHLEIYQMASPDPAGGEELFHRYCSRCHDTGRYSRYDKFFGHFIPAVRGQTYVQIATRAYLKRNIEKGHPDTIMPAWEKAAGGLSKAEIDRIVDFILATPVQPGKRLSQNAVELAKVGDSSLHGNAENGAKLFLRNCAACHAADGRGGLGPSLRNKTFQQAATDGFIYTTVAHGRHDSAMPGWLAPGGGGLDEQAIRDIVVHLRTFAPPEIVDKEDKSGEQENNL